MCKPHYSSNLNPITDFDLTWPTWSGIVCNKALKPTPSQPPPEPHIYPQNLAEGLGACRVRGHEVAPPCSEASAVDPVHGLSQASPARRPPPQDLALLKRSQDSINALGPFCT